ncbi:TPA: hypothetical protein U5D93_004439 [Yersinia enterocolitica]|nr:hypothetical protein [Yersinia enterocolitica]HEN3299358.1 hypothetical protein [Yersinia enterocolitica]HEN3394283.1 hypothetical protein [Yersinia enterocolitica]
MSKKIFSTLLLFISMQSSVTAKIIDPENENYLYTGRIDFNQPHIPKISWPGTSIIAKFTGSSLSIWLDDQNGKNYYNVIIDDDNTPYVIEAKKGKHKYWISETLSSGNHKVEIYKRTEGEEGYSLFSGIDIADDSDILPPPKRLVRKIEIYGDSISTGMAIEAPINGKEDNPVDKNNYLAYGALAARELNAEVHSITQSGIGIMVSWFDFTMPQFYDQLNADGNNDSQWDFKKWTPDVVLINLLQNDSWLIENPEKIGSKPTPNEIITHYIYFVRSIRSKYPNAEIICALGSMDTTKEGSPWPGYVEKAVNIMKDEDNDSKLHTLFFDFNGYEHHPRIIQNRVNAKKLVNKIREITHW